MQVIKLSTSVAAVCLLAGVAGAQISYGSQFRRVSGGSETVDAPDFGPFDAVAQNRVQQGPNNFYVYGDATQTSSLEPGAIVFDAAGRGGGCTSTMNIVFDVEPGSTLTLTGEIEQTGGPNLPLATARVTITGPGISYASPDQSFNNLNHTILLGQSQVLPGGNYTFTLTATGGSQSFAGNLMTTTGSAVGRMSITPACAADIGGSGGLPARDHQLDNNDFIVFISWFFQQDARADFGSTGGVAGADGSFDNNDFIAFINAFFAGCS